MGLPWTCDIGRYWNGMEGKGREVVLKNANGVLWNVVRVIRRLEELEGIYFREEVRLF
jgi:hypothetical protein